MNEKKERKVCGGSLKPNSQGTSPTTPGERPPLWIRDDLVSVRFFLLGGGGTSSYYSVCIFFSLSLSAANVMNLFVLLRRLNGAKDCLAGLHG